VALQCRKDENCGDLRGIRRDRGFRRLGERQGSEDRPLPDLPGRGLEQLPASRSRRSWFVRVGTMDNPDLCPPDIHIFTSSKQPWVTLSPSAKTVPEFYDLDAVWSAESLERRRIMRAKAKQP
jgi:hypothetical protein